MSPNFLPSLPDLPGEVRRMLAQVPAGHVTTYGDLAKGLGNVIASRWIGSLLLHDPQTSRLAQPSGRGGLTEVWDCMPMDQSRRSPSGCAKKVSR